MKHGVIALVLVAASGCAWLSTEEDVGACTGVIGGAPVELRLRPGRSSYRVEALTDDGLITLRYADDAGDVIEVDARLERFGATAELEPAPLFTGRPTWIVRWTEALLSPVDGTLRVDYLSDYDAEGAFTYALGGSDQLACTFDLSRPASSSSSSSSDWD
ncbi:MAG: hypothetical protein H6723_19910 [Sandaracinus sp.]|nr:hypothetical protein [Sandaracinus sp.]